MDTNIKKNKKTYLISFLSQLVSIMLLFQYLGILLNPGAGKTWKCLNPQGIRNPIRFKFLVILIPYSIFLSSCLIEFSFCMFSITHFVFYLFTFYVIFFLYEPFYALSCTSVFGLFCSLSFSTL